MVDVGVVDVGMVDVGMVDVGMVDVGVVDVRVVDVVEKSIGILIDYKYGLCVIFGMLKIIMMSDEIFIFSDIIANHL